MSTERERLGRLPHTRPVPPLNPAVRLLQDQYRIVSQVAVCGLLYLRSAPDVCADPQVWTPEIRFSPSANENTPEVLPVGLPVSKKGTYVRPQAASERPHRSNASGRGRQCRPRDAEDRMSLASLSSPQHGSRESQEPTSAMTPGLRCNSFRWLACGRRPTPFRCVSVDVESQRRMEIYISI